MKSSLTVFATVLFCAAVGALAQTTASAPASAPTTASAPASKPATMSMPAVVASVGDVQITAQQVQKIIDSITAMQPIPEAQMDVVRREITYSLVQQELFNAYMATKNIDVSDAEMKEQQDLIAKAAAAENTSVEQFMSLRGITDQRIRTQVRLSKLIKEMTADEKVNACMKEHPEYFDGSTLTASHILVSCQPFASSAQQVQAREKLEQAVADIKAGKATFEEAAAKVSDCPSKEKGGDLGEFDFEGMLPSFSIAAFALKGDELSPIIRTQAGFHVIKVTKRTPGTTTMPAEVAKQTAGKALMTTMENELFEFAAKKCKIEIAPEILAIKDPTPPTTQEAE